MKRDDRPRNAAAGDSGGWTRLLRPRDQSVVAVATWLAFSMLAAKWAYQTTTSAGLVDIDKTASNPARFVVDPNSADWPELTLLPGIGEKLAKRIVESRRLEGPFRRPRELVRVRGVGPKTMERIRPFLFPIDVSSDPPDR